MLDGYLSAAVDLWSTHPIPTAIGLGLLCLGAFYVMAQS